MKKIKVLFVASELTPIAKVGGLGDVISALPKELRKNNIDARIIIPRYEQISIKKLRCNVRNIPIHFGRIKEKITLYKTTINRVPIYLINNPKYLSRGHIYADRSAFVGSTGEAKRFLFFSCAAVQLLNHLDWNPNILHLNDWHTALIPQLLKYHTKTQTPKTLLTIHNLANQGSFPDKEILSFLGIQKTAMKQLKIRDRYGKLNLFQQGITSSSLLNTVSPTYAKEILTKQLGEGLEKTLQKRKSALSGILNGIDTNRFNPERDRYIQYKYSSRNVRTKKQLNKIALLKEMKIYPSISGEKTNKGITFGIVSRLTDQKGIDLIIKTIPIIVKSGGQFIFLGQGQKKFEDALIKIQKKYPRAVAGKIGFDAALAQRIYAGSDIFLMPSRFEPCGLGQMIAMQYGAIPIVRQTGGLKDTVTNLKISKSQNLHISHIRATGFVFKKYSVNGLARAIKHAINIYCKHPNIWRKIQLNGMEKDFSWKKSAKKYTKLYKKILTHSI